MRGLFFVITLPLLVVACGSSEDNASNTTAAHCPGLDTTLPTGDPFGHPDPIGAKAAGQARAGRVADSTLIAEPIDRRIRVRLGDYVLINDTIAVFVEDVGLSDGYARFGGELLAIDRVGDDGAPMGLSQYGETLLGLSNEMINAESVSVMADGSDGGPAIVRVVGNLAPVPFIDESLGVLFPREYGSRAALDYVLEPGSPKLTVRLRLINDTDEPLNLALDELHGFFHTARSQMATAEHGYDEPSGLVSQVEFDGGPWGFAWRSPNGGLYASFAESGFAMFNGPGFEVGPCSVHERDHVEIIAGGPDLDGIREAVRSADGAPAWRVVEGVVLDDQGERLPGAWIHELASDGTYLSRTRTDDKGEFRVHAPDQDVTIVPELRGYPKHEGAALARDKSRMSVSFAPHATLEIVAVDADQQTPLPVRIQVIPTVEPELSPSAWGVEHERRGRIHQTFALEGKATLPVPPGEHRVVVSRGYEYELADEVVTVAAGESRLVSVALARSVDSGGWMCTDFHVHTNFSADSGDSLDHKVAGGAADGLDIMTISDHEWVTDPAPAVERLGMGAWMAAVTSLELTTFSWGHFGVVPIEARADDVNNGAIDWVKRTPGEVFDMVDALPERPALVVNHPRAAGFGGYFSAAGFDRATSKGRDDLWSDNFDVIEVCNGSSFDDNRNDAVADWFSLLEAGRNVWGVGSSDNHHLVSNPVGYPRACLQFGHDDPRKLSAQHVRDRLLAGAVVISGGLLLTVEGPTGEIPGQVVVAPGPTVTFTVTVQAPTWVQATELETIVDGVTRETVPLLPVENKTGQRFVQTVEVPVDASRPRSFVIFHARGEGDLSPVHPGLAPFAFSNPIFVQGS